MVVHDGGARWWCTMVVHDGGARWWCTMVVRAGLTPPARATT
jgi:hypothetical protein